MNNNDTCCCCCTSESMHSCNCAGQEIEVLGKTAQAKMDFDSIPELLAGSEESFSMLENHKLTTYAESLWNLHKEVIDDTLAGGWNNCKHPWAKELQDFWRYPLAFCTYGLLSMAMIVPERKDEICEYVRKTVLLMKDAPIWDEWVRYGFCDNPITKDNIMYKGHLNFVYGIYQLLSGSKEFEPEHQFLTDIMLKEYDANRQGDNPYWGIQCEPDQYFPQCNSIGMMSLKIYDMIHGTNYDEEYSKKVYRFIYDRVSDKETGLLFAKYHPSHDQGEAYITGFCNAWGLTMLHPYNKALLEKGYKIFIKNFAKEMMGGAGAYIKEYADYDEASTGIEESMGVFYATALTREFNDPKNWEKFSRYFTGTYGIEIHDGMAALTKATAEDETFVHNYLLWGELHMGWDKVLSYDWDAFRNNGGLR